MSGGRRECTARPEVPRIHHRSPWACRRRRQEGRTSMAFRFRFSCPQSCVIIGAAAATVPVGGAAAAFGGASAAAPKSNLHHTLPHNSASRSSRLKTFEEA